MKSIKLKVLLGLTEEDEYMTKNRVFQVSAVLLLNELDLF